MRAIRRGVSRRLSPARSTPRARSRSWAARSAPRRSMASCPASGRRWAMAWVTRRWRPRMADVLRRERTGSAARASHAGTVAVVEPSGGGGIRTLGTVARTTVFETARFSHSRTPPRGRRNGSNRVVSCRAWTTPPSSASPTWSSASARTCSPTRSSRSAASRERSGWSGRSRRARTATARSSWTSAGSIPTSSARGCSTRGRRRSTSCRSWYGERVLALGDQRAARIALSGPSAPGLLSDLDPALVGKDHLPAVKEGIQVVNERTTNWTIAPARRRSGPSSCSRSSSRPRGSHGSSGS